jgi:vanillate/4-hydroxybenzoate decarboxylase subunit C
MAHDDLRQFLKALDEQGQLRRITDEVMPEPDIAADRQRRAAAGR